MRISFSLALFLALNYSVFSQNNDSLVNIIHNTSNDSIKAEALNQLALNLIYENPDSSISIVRKALKLANQSSLENQKVISFDHLARIYWIKSNFDSSLYYINQKIIFYEANNDSAGLAGSINNQGMIYENMGDPTRALNHYLKSVRIFEELIEKDSSNVGYRVRLASILNNIGNIYAKQEKRETARKYYHEAKDINLKYGLERNLANNFMNIGLTYQAENNNLFAINYLKKALEIHLKNNDRYGLSEVYNNLAVASGNIGNYTRAEQYFQKAIEHETAIGDVYSLSVSHHGIGQLYLGKGKIKKAIEHFQKSINLATKAKLYEDLYKNYSAIAEAYAKIGNTDKAYEYSKKHNQLKDSLINEASIKEIEKLKAQYESEKKEHEIELLNKEKKIKDYQLKEQELLVSKEHNRLIVALVGIILCIVLAFILYIGYRNKQKANTIIRFQKRSLEEKNEELNKLLEETKAQRDEIERQKQLVETINEEVHNSITYARRLQESILPTKEDFKTIFPKGFVFYSPKDILSGDFYWVEKINHQIFFAVIDCTGHGVPGALMSVVGNVGLNKAVLENELYECDQILNYLNQYVIDKVHRGNENIKDGMDMALCRLNTDTLELQISGANNPIYLVRNNEIEVFKSSKCAIGEKDASYKLKNIQLLKGDQIYLFSDGYADQFGGPKNRKFTYKRLRNLFVEIKPLSPNEKLFKLINTFEDWRGGEMQIDDVCIMSVEI